MLRKTSVVAVASVWVVLAAGTACQSSPDRGGSPASSPAARILTNQVGYEAAGPKRAVVQGRAGDAFNAFAVKRYPGGETVLSGTPAHAGPVAKWKDWDFWTIDWSAVDQEGTYLIECATENGATGTAAAGAASAVIRSHPILVQRKALERATLSDVLYYFKGQRSSGLWDKSDRRMTFEGRTGLVDIHGGWFDATGDYGKHLSHLSYASFFNPQQVSLTAWSLWQTLRQIERRGERDFTQYRKRLLDEALYGADYLVRSKDPNGSFYITVSGRGPEKKPEDRRIAAKAERHIILTPETKDKFRDYGREKIAGDAAYEAGYREGAGLCIAALAMAAARGGRDGRPGSEGYGLSRGEGDFTAADYLQAAEDAFAFLEKNNLRFTNDGRENILDDYCALTAATELYRTTRKGRIQGRCGQTGRIARGPIDVLEERRRGQLRELLAGRRPGRRPALFPSRRRRDARREPAPLRRDRGRGGPGQGSRRRSCCRSASSSR